MRNPRSLFVLLVSLSLWSCSGSDGPTEPKGNGADTQAPSVSITAPTAGAAFLTGEATVTISGTSSDAVGVVRVDWSVSGGASGTATGTTSWNVTDIALAPGANTISVTAVDEAGNSSSDQLTVTRDNEPPSIVISGPTTSDAYSTVAATLTVSGTANDNVGLDRVEWSTDGGAGGTASGEEVWEILGLALELGQTQISVLPSIK